MKKNSGRILGKFLLHIKGIMSNKILAVIFGYDMVG